MYYGLTAEPAYEMTADKIERLVDVEKDHIIKTLKMFDGHRGKTAESLGIDRKTLRMKMKTYGID